MQKSTNRSRAALNHTGRASSGNVCRTKLWRRAPLHVVTISHCAANPGRCVTSHGVVINRLHKCQGISPWLCNGGIVRSALTSSGNTEGPPARKAGSSNVKHTAHAPPILPQSLFFVRTNGGIAGMCEIRATATLLGLQIAGSRNAASNQWLPSEK